MSNTQQLPAEIIADIHAKADAYMKYSEDEGTEWGAYVNGATEYATRLPLVEQEKEFYKTKLINEKEFFEDGYKDLQARHTTARTLLQKFISRHEAGLLPDRFMYDEIKQFLDGTK